MPTMIHELLNAIQNAPLQDMSTPIANSWLLGFDTETTGARVGYDAIVSATLVLRNTEGTQDDIVATWLINPHQPIHPQASNVNGFTDEFVQTHGGEPVEEIEALAHAITLAQAKHIPLLAYNAPFDVRMLEHDLTRWNLPSLTDRMNQLKAHTMLPSNAGNTSLLVLDPLVIDRALSFRSGKRTLTAATEFYGVTVSGSFHDATADTIAAVDLIQPMCATYPTLAELTLQTMMDWQREAYKRWQISFNRWLQSKGRTPTSDRWL